MASTEVFKATGNPILAFKMSGLLLGRNLPLVFRLMPQKKITDHPQSGWFDEAPSKGRKSPPMNIERPTSNFE